MVAQAGTTDYAYDMNRNMGSAERVEKAGASTEIRRRIGGAVLVVEKLDGNDVVQPQSTIRRYQLLDHLGSPIAVYDNNALPKERLSFGSWGGRRDYETPAVELTTLTTVTTRGYTGHEHGDAFGLIHMNGRIYDPTLGRMLQADPFIQAPTDTQSYNRYSYARNNPLRYTDPSGYSWKEWAGPVVAIAGTVICYGNPSCGAAAYTAIGASSGAASAAANGGSIVQGAIVGGISGAAFYGVGGAVVGQDLVVQVFAFGVVGGITSVASGGELSHGFISAGAGSLIPGVGVGNVGDAVARTIGRAIIGGTVSEITGGKFANGAATAAFMSIVAEGTAAAGAAKSVGGEKVGEVHSHGVFAVGKHGSARFYPDDPAAIDAFLKDNGFSEVLQVDQTTGRQYIVFSGGPDFNGPGLLGNLSGDINRVGDLATKPNNLVGSVYAPSAVGKDGFIKRLITNTRTYNSNRVNYDLLPGVSSGYNSNSYFRGLINSGGGSIQGNINWQYQGFNKPVPGDRF